MKNILSTALTYKSAIFTDTTRDIAVSSAAFVFSTIWLQLWIYLTKAGKLNSILARKIIHTGSAPLFLALWPFYSSNNMWPARIAAATVGLAQICRIIYSGLKKQSTKEDFGLARTISRSGDIKEALYGPLIYAGVLLGVTLGLFRYLSHLNHTF